MIRGHLKLLVLKLLEKEPKNGYTLMENIEKVMGVRPSSGSIYPLLDSLTKEKLVEVNEDGKTKTYSLTKQGKHKLKEIKNKKKEIVEKITGMMQILETFCDDSDPQFFKKFISHMDKGDMFFPLHPEIIELQHILMEKSKKNKNIDQIKKVLKKTIAEVKSI